MLKLKSVELAVRLFISLYGRLFREVNARSLQAKQKESNIINEFSQKEIAVCISEALRIYRN